jgi:hypothetical protein
MDRIADPALCKWKFLLELFTRATKLKVLKKQQFQPTYSYILGCFCDFWYFFQVFQKLVAITSMQAALTLYFLWKESPWYIANGLCWPKAYIGYLDNYLHARCNLFCWVSQKIIMAVWRTSVSKKGRKSIIICSGLLYLTRSTGG